MKIDGACHCGNIRYEAEIDPADVIVCHCTDCQSLSGSAFRTVVFADESTFRFLGGEPSVYVKTAQSGNRREQTFCPKCGSPIYSADADMRPRTLGIRLGTARQRDQLPPRKQYWARSAQRWLPDLESLERLTGED